MDGEEMPVGMVLPLLVGWFCFLFTAMFLVLLVGALPGFLAIWYTVRFMRSVVEPKVVVLELESEPDEGLDGNGGRGVAGVGPPGSYEEVER